MPERVDVTDVQLSAPRVVAAAAPVAGGEPPRMVDAAVTVANQSDTTTFHVISSLRSLRYDPATQTLELGFVDPPPDPARTPITIFPPTLTPLAPGESRVLQAAAPLVIRQLRRSAGLGVEYDEIDISGVQHVRTTVAYDSTPFRAAGPRAGIEMRRQLAAWGERAEATFERTLPSAGSERGRSRRPRRS